MVVTFLATNYAPGNDLDEHFLRSTIETGGLPGFNFFPHVGKISIDGPFNAKGASDTESRRKIFVCKPTSPAQETACAKQIVTALARHAFRRPVTAQDTEMLMGFYQQGRNEGGDFDHGIEMALRRILVDPEFFFRKEVEPANVTPGKNTASAIWSWPRACRSSCGPAFRTTSCWIWPPRTSCTNRRCWSSR